MTENKHEHEYQHEHEYVLMEKVYNHDSKVDRDNEISLRDLFRILIRGKKVILLSALIVLLLVTVVSLVIPHVKVGTKGELQTAVQLYFPEIKNGNAPNGQKYDPNEMKSVEVLEEAIASAGLKDKRIKLQALQANIKLTALLPEDTALALNRLNKLKSEEVKLDRLENMEINPDAYIVSLNVSNKLGISMEEGRRLLDSIAYSYRDWLIRTYGARPALSNVFYSAVKLEDYDYIQAVDVLNKQLTDMENYVTTGMSQTEAKSALVQTLREIKDVLTSIRAVEIEGLYTKIGAFYLTKDPQRSEAICRQKAEEQAKLAAQKAEEAASLREVIANYHSNEQTIVLGDAGQAALTLKDESAQYNQFVTQYTLAKDNEASASAEADYYRRQADRFAGMQAATNADSLMAKETVQNISTTKEKLVYWTDEINRISDEYVNDAMYRQYAEQMIPAKAYHQESSVNLLMNMAIALAAGLMIGILMVLLREFLRNEE